MNTGSTISAPDTPTARTCPAWCESTAADHAEGTHYGPAFGDLTPQLLENGTLGVFVPQYEDALTADELRQLAAQLAAAADWIEAHR